MPAHLFSHARIHWAGQAGRVSAHKGNKAAQLDKAGRVYKACECRKTDG